MAQDFVEALYRWFLSGVGVLRQLLPLLLIALLGGAAIWLAFRRFAPEETDASIQPLRRAWAKSWRISAVVLVLLILCGSLVTAREMVETRRGTVHQALASHHKDPQLSGIVQYAPSIAVMEEKTYTRSLTVPPFMVTRIGAEGLQVLSPYLTDPSADGVEKLVDSFKRSGRDVVFTRELTRLDQIAVPADSADVQVRFDIHGTRSGQRFYEAEFNGIYKFKNPRPAAANMRFVFPLPQGGGTVQGFYFDVAGKRTTEPDEHGQYSWTGSVAPGAEVPVSAHYRVTGGGAYDYLLGSESRRIGNFHFAATGADQLQFGKSGIYPTSLSGSKAEWQLQDVLTAQSIAIVFPRADLQVQLLDKTLTMLPLSLVIFAIASLLFVPTRAMLGTACFGLGLLAVPVFSAYATPQTATLVGAVLAGIAGGLALGGRKGWGLALLCALLCTSFLTAEHGALWVWSLAVIALASCWGMRKAWFSATASP